MNSGHFTPHPIVDELRNALAGEVRADLITRQLYSTDASDFRKVPTVVVIPRSAAEVATVVKAAARHNLDLIPRGGGSSLSGQTVGTGLILDLSKYMNRLVELNLAEKWVVVESGMVLDHLNARIAPQGLMVGPDPSSSAVATIGGMAGNNSTGSHSIKYGMMADHVIALEVVLSDGSIVWLDGKNAATLQKLAERDTLEGRLYRSIPALLETYRKDIETGYPRTWRNVAGYNLNRLLNQQKKGEPFNLAPLVVGSEGTLAVITRIKLKLVERPRHLRLMLLPFAALEPALTKVPFILGHRPSAVELMSQSAIKLAADHQAMRPAIDRWFHQLPGAALIVELTGDTADDIANRAEKLETSLREDGFDEPITHCVTETEITAVWWIRKSVLGLQVSDPIKTKPIWIIDDATVPVDQMASFTRQVKQAGEKQGVEITFDAHASVGCLHMGLELDLKTVKGHRLLKILSREIISLAIAHGGTSTGEHGEGLARSYFNKQVYGERLHAAFEQVKHAFDPENRLNPNKILEAIEPWDQQWHKFTPGVNLPQDPKKTFFDFSTYKSFGGLVEMCNGQGNCRGLVSGTMCPTFRLTREEMHSTRGRANALRAALAGELGPDGLSNEMVYEVLDLCLACKACKAECSTRVDLAKLKMEFLAHYQAKHGVPLRSRMFGAMALASRAGSLMPAVTNHMYHNRTLRKVLDRTLAIDQRRALPPLAPQTFQAWFKRHDRPSTRPTGKVILWDDCHISYHQPHLGKAAVRILEAAGFEVICLNQRKCCGRPQLSKGLLKQARTNARHNMALLFSYARAGIPIIGVEPSCIACFREEYPDLLQTDQAKTVASQCFFFEEFICHLVDRKQLNLKLKIPPRPRDILLHTHCYQKAYGTAEKVVKMLRLLPDTQVTEIASGCCGMAGTFGYEKEHYDISMAIGEMALFPAVRAAGRKTLIAAAGTSCREQIKDGTQRIAQHPVVLLAEALE